MMVRKTRPLCLLLVLFLIAASLSGCSSQWIGQMFGKGSLVINEVCTSNSSSLIDDEFGTPDWVELFNSGSSEIRLKDYALSNDIKNPIKYLLPDVTIAPGAYKIIYFSKLESKTADKVSTGFKLSANGGMVILTASGGDTLAKLEVPALSADQSYARDEKGDYHVSAKATPGAANNIIEAGVNSKTAEMPSGAPVHITEVLVDNGFSLVDEDGERSGWVEIENSSSAAVSLAGYRLSDDADEPAKWSFPNVSIAPGQRMVVFCSGKDKVTQSGQLHANFRLGKGDLQICLLDMVKMQMQTVTLTNNLKENVSYGIQNGQWLYFGQPTPGQPNNTHGVQSMSDANLFDNKGLYISEAGAAHDYKSTSSDWIELHNGSGTAINLQGYYLSDDKDNLKKGKIGNVTVQPDGYVTITVSGNPNKQGGSVLPFGLSSSGETLILSSPEGVPIDVFDTGVTRPGITSGRLSGDASGARVFFNSPSYGTANSQSSIRGYVQKPTFSEPGGVKTSAVSVTISTTTPNARIYYTTDGSTPTTQSKLYSGPISVNSSTPLRAYAVSDGLLSSDVATETYLYTQPHSVPVVCLSMNPGDFTTMYANDKTYINIEKPGNIEYYDKDGKLGTEFPASIFVSGWSTRSNSYRQKSLTFKLDDAYGMEEVNYPFFDGYPITTFASLRMRMGGQDRASTYLRDAFLARLALAGGLDADAPNNRYTVLYVNGKYWGLYDFREEISKDMLASHHNVEPTSVDYMRRQTVRYGSNAKYDQIRNYAKSHSLNDPANYAQFCEWVDVSAWADYLVLRNYFRETDMFNQKYWMTEDYAVKLRPIYFDNDFSLTSSGALSTYLIDYYLSFNGFTTKNGSFVNMDVTAALWTSSQFKKLFMERWAYHTMHTFAADRIIPMLDSVVAEMEPEMQRQITRWGEPQSMSFWKSELDEFRSLIRQRPTSAKELLRVNFNLSDAKMQDLFK